LTKIYPGVIANEDITWSLRPGEIHAFLGENGAGKSTLMNMIYGLTQPDRGEIWVKGERVAMRDPNVAIALGIGMVHQHFMLIDTLTVAENIILGMEPHLAGMWVDRRKAIKSIQEISDRYGLSIDLHAKVGDISVGMQQRVEIIKALYRGAEILILDEPTAVLTPQEVDELFETLQRFTDGGKSIIFITHKMREVLALADRITILRNGRIVGTADPEKCDQKELARLIVGRTVNLKVEKTLATPGEVVLSVNGLKAHNDRRLPALNGVDLEVRSGEILGIAGVEGNGQTELIEVLAGLRQRQSGEITLNGESLKRATPRKLLDMGIAHIPENRHRRAVIMKDSIENNMVLSNVARPPFSRWSFLSRRAIAASATRLMAQFQIKAPDSQTALSSLSGGNQQKVVVARELSRSSKVLLASQPTRGVDAGAIEFIHSQIVAKRDEGWGVLLVSAELDEILALADRIAVLYKGQIVATIDAAEADRDKLGLMMLSGKLS